MLNGILVLDKPSDWTSFDAVAKLRGLLRERRIGHAGTLDPMATGVLPIFVGKATRACDYLMSADKEYLARFVTGISTDTQDVTGTVLTRSENVPGPEAVRAALMRFTGDILQIPPMYSAIKKDGKKLYELARRGIEVEREPRSVTIKALALTDCLEGGYEFEIKVTCSKGTYVRTLCHDVGTYLGCGAAMSALRRLRTGVFTLDGAYTLEQVEQATRQGQAESLLTPVDRLFYEYPAVTVAEQAETALRNGAPVYCPEDFTQQGMCRVYARSGEFLMLGDAQSEGAARMINRVKNFF